MGSPAPVVLLRTRSGRPAAQLPAIHFRQVVQDAPVQRLQVLADKGEQTLKPTDTQELHGERRPPFKSGQIGAATVVAPCGSACGSGGAHAGRCRRRQWALEPNAYQQPPLQTSPEAGSTHMCYQRPCQSIFSMPSLTLTPKRAGKSWYLGRPRQSSSKPEPSRQLGLAEGVCSMRR